MLQYRILGSKEVLDRYEKMQKSIPPLMYRTMLRACLEVSKVSKKDYLTGPRPERLGVVTGRLRSSINVRVEKKGKEVVGLVGTNVFYGKIHELIGVGKSKIKRPFLGPALEQKRTKVRQMFERAGTELVK